MPEPDSPVASSKRRTILAVLGAGVCAVIGGMLFWRPGSSPQVKDASATQPPAPKVKPSSSRGPEAISDATNSDAQTSESVQPMTRAWFLPHLHSPFQMQADNFSSTVVELMEVGAAVSIVDKDHHITYTSFSLLFRGPKDMTKESQIFQLNHERLGKMELFLSPIGKYKDQVRYEAILNQRV